MWLFILAVAGALLISALCSLMEATLLSLRPSQVAEMSSRWPRIGAVWRRFEAEIDRPIAAILILNTAAHTIGASVAGAEFNSLFGDDWIWVFSLVFTLLMLQFTEIMPKSAGVRYNRHVAVWIAQPLVLLTYVLLPVVHFVHWFNRPSDRVAVPAQSPPPRWKRSPRWLAWRAFPRRSALARNGSSKEARGCLA